MPACRRPDQRGPQGRALSHRASGSCATLGCLWAFSWGLAAHVRPETAPVHHPARRRGGGMAVRGTRTAAADAGGRVPQQRVARHVWSHMSAPSNWPRNRLLLGLPSRNLKQLLPELEYTRCEREQVLMDADSSLDYVFFPDGGVVSVMAVYAEGGTIEMATIGREGCTGVQAVFGAKNSSARFFVQIPGSAAKMPRSAFYVPWSRCRRSEASCTLTSRPFSSRS